MQPIPLVRTSSVRPLFQFLERSPDAPVRRVLESARPVFREAEGLMPFALAGALWEQAARACGLETLGLRIGERCGIMALGDWGRVLGCAPTLGAALEAAIQVSRRFNSGQRLWITRLGDEIWFQRSFSPSLRRGRRAVSDFALMMTLDAIRQAAGPGWRPSEIHLEGDPPGHAAELAALAEKRIFFGRPHMAVVFPRALLALRFGWGPASHPALTTAPVPASDFEGSVRQTVAALLRFGRTELPAAAEAAGMSVRSFQRRLAEAGLGFGALVDAARCEVAWRMLEDPGLRIVEVAAELGYSDSSNFTRAFRRWNGVSPREFRRSHPHGA